MFYNSICHHFSVITDNFLHPRPALQANEQSTKLDVCGHKVEHEELPSINVPLADYHHGH